ncbi:anti-sigma regulatory factor (Ser/Thr protein kinase) [Povalibacter uvarum]|uniref:Anti-sigma regulatory factor (Ser/Thr protein kinase) n=1 Tax=Povalibacter uvarum TaxID=732238 RepID=A0A841HSX2_9GAMM|nr:SpoIIE family protein phosphatase [Povalibacter uvarum]MBB6095118.1 anti-sigma regulatory factor (Ser/Thr protein kinase) [Povalibacter uvarum]
MRAVAVTEASQVSEARRRASELAGTLGADETIAGRAAIVATELASNLVKHGGGGQLLVSSYEDGSGHGIQCIALDRGRGIANLQECMRDGYSTAGGSAGAGLGAVQRQSSFMQVASWPGVGTALLARISLAQKQKPAANAASAPAHGFVCVPMTGEEVCGDAAQCVDDANGRTLLVADGLGHGPQAAAAAMEAMRLFARHRHAPVTQILEFLHAGLRATRGAAVAVARFEFGKASIVYGGIGNIAGVIVGQQETRRMISHNGTAGHVARRIQSFDYPYSAGGLVIMHSDGLGTGWSLDRYPGILRMHPTLIAAILYRDYSRGRDDTTVLVADMGRRP